MTREGAILLVDDDETVQEFGAMALARLGFEVLTASDGNECLEVFNARADDVRLIVMDLLLPDFNGDKVCEELRARGVQTPVLLCSGMELTESEVFNAGATAFLSKPYRMRELGDICEALLSR